MRTSAQGYGAPDSGRQRYALLERDFDEAGNQGSGLDHAGWRKYDSDAGRWTSPDPYKGSMSVSNPQSFNRYAYVQNDPVNFVDPSGLEKYVEPPWWWGLWDASNGGDFLWVEGWGERPIYEPKKRRTSKKSSQQDNKNLVSLICLS